MAFLKKLLKRKGGEEDRDEDDGIMDWDSPADLEPDPDEDDDVPSYGLGSVTQAGGPVGASEQPNGLSSGGDADSPEGDGPEGQPGDREQSPISVVMDIFDEEPQVDTRLESLTSWVEDVDANELVEEIRALVDELERR